MFKKKEIRNPLYLFLLIFVTWGLYRYFFHFPEWMDEFVFKPLIMLLPVLYFSFKIEKKSLSAIGLSNKNFLRNILIGLGVGLFICFEAIITKYFKNNSIIINPNNLTGFSLLITILIPFATGFVEEVVFRGYIMNNFWKVFNNELTANILSTFLFVAIHFPIFIFIRHLSSFELIISIFQLSVLGAINAYLFARTKTIVASTTTHWLWNLSVVIFR